MNANIIPATESDYPALIKVWEASVRASHDFLPEDYLQEIKSLLPSIFPHVRIVVVKDKQGNIAGFLGTGEDKIEMLFIRPDMQGINIGSLLTRYAINQLQIRKVDVNEQNPRALGFYERMGFVITRRNELDSMGRPFPILEMELK
ncbi:MAG TPA: GNAT family N-acetyltransferase [Chitinophagaceae bacterium]|nr:GNAT family N-acetyltransferase [Chitinophagaceae bacterium]